MYEHRARIGYTVAAVTIEVFPIDFYKIVPDGVTLMMVMLPLGERSPEDVKRCYDISIEAAKTMAEAGADLVLLGGLPINLSRGGGWNLKTLGKIPVECALEWAHALKEEHPEIDTFNFACPHWRVIDAIEPLEQELKVNVMTSLQAIAWEAMRKAGIDDRIDGYGRLLREH